MDDQSLYDRDIYAWAETQAAALRRLAETRRDLPNDLDVENIAEEIDGMARTELFRAESFLRLLFIHIVKLASAPNSSAVGHWRTEVSAFQSDFVDSLSATIIRKINVGRRWRLALDQAGGQLALHGDVILPDIPTDCPFSIAELAEEPFDLDATIGKLRAAVKDESDRSA